MNEVSLIKLDALQQALAEAKSIPEVKNLRDQLATAKEWLKKRQAHRLDKNAIAECQIRAERKLGWMLQEEAREPGETDKKIMLDNQTLSPKLPDFGISRFQSHWWQRVADIPEELLATYISEINADGEDKLPISTLGFIRWHLRQQKPEPSGDWLPLPEGKYRTLVIDPPWPIAKMELDERTPEIGIEYDIKTIDQITKLDIPSLLSPDGCHIYLWTTQKHLPISFEIIESWGVNYIFTMAWHKAGGFQPVKLPQYNSEFALFGRSSGLQFMDTRNFFTCFNGKRRGHSRKPNEFYELVSRVSPPPRLDIFAREKHEGFDQYGNETEKFSNVSRTVR